MTEDSSPKVVPLFKAPPKATKIQYKGREISITYQPASGVWHWEFVQTSRTPFEGEAETEAKALSIAKRKIDYIDGDDK